jgi:hypothetical protein
MSDLGETTEIENSSLPAHVSICSQRYKQLELRLITLEVRMESVQKEIIDSQKSLKTTIITSAGSIVVALIGVIGTILTKF